MKLIPERLRQGAATAGAATASLAATAAGYAATAAASSGPDGMMEGILRPQNEIAFYLLWGLAGALTGLAATAVILYQIRPSKPGRLERMMDRTALPAICGAAALLAAGAVGHLAARNAL